jgi:sec-independent protein translocase protein TatC
MPQISSVLRSARVRPVEHGQRLSAVDHLDELRTRLIVSLITIAVAFGICFWQNHQLLRIINQPLAQQTQQQVRDGHGPLGATYTVQQAAKNIATQLNIVTGLLASEHQPPATHATLTHVHASLNHDITQLSTPPQGNQPVTLGVGEPFNTTIGVTLIFALILSLPVLLLQAYGFLMPAFDPHQRRRMLPIIAAIPVLFITGVAFGYLVVLPAALHFFQNFNSSQFNVLVQASQYYTFAATTLLAMGLLFEIPVAIIAITRAGIITPKQLRHNRRYAILTCGLVAAILPGDAITMLLEVLPLYLLFEASVLLATISERRERKHTARQAANEPSPRPAST